MKLPAITIAIIAITASAFGQAAITPTPVPSSPTYTAASAAYNALPATTTKQDRVTAYQKVAQANDESTDLQAESQRYLGFLQWDAGYDPSVYLATILQAYQAFNYRPAFVLYATYSYKLGGTYGTSADSLVPAFITANPSGADSYAVLAYKAESAKDWPTAYTSWKAVADSFTSWTELRGNAVTGMINASVKKGDTPQVRNAFIITYLTQYNVDVADGSYQAAANAVNRSPTVMSLADLKAFLVGIERVVLVTDTNAKFLGTVQSQLNALPAN